MSEKRSMRFEAFRPRHVLGLAAIAAFAVLMQPVAASAAGSLVSIVDGTTNATARVDSAGNLAVSTRSADVPVTIFDQTVHPGSFSGATVATGGYRSVQIYAYAFKLTSTSSSTANSLTVTVPFRFDKVTTAPDASVLLATWGSGTPAYGRSGPAQSLTRNAPQPALNFTASNGGYSWRVIVYGVK